MRAVGASWPASQAGRQAGRERGVARGGGSRQLGQGGKRGKDMEESYEGEVDVLCLHNLDWYLHGVHVCRLYQPYGSATSRVQACITTQLHPLRGC